MAQSTVEPVISAVETIIDNGKFGTRTIKFETGLLARQAAGSVTAYLDDETMLLSATTAGKTPKDQFDFFPLTIDVEERMYAVGQIPGSFFRSEGRPGEDAILTCRLIDRPLRPTFKKGLRNEVQVVITVLALDPAMPYDVLAINAASLSTQLSGLPFSGPVGGVRVALIDGQWVAFPSHGQLEDAVFDMVVAGRVTETGDVAIMMVEAEATEQTWNLVQSGAQAPTEEIVAGGLDAAKPFIKQLCAAQSQLAAEAAKPVMDFPVFLDYEDDVYAAVEASAKDDTAVALQIAGKQDREERLDAIKAVVLEKVGPEFEGREKEIGAAFRSLNKSLVRERVLRDKVRIDGRGLADIRPLHAEVAVIPRVHGSALFERGETQILGVTTLNMLTLEQKLDTLSPEKSRRYMHKYVFPPFSTGETGRVGSPKRREVGHGALARRALLPVLPTREEFPYAIRQLSEAMGSNGSTSMGSVCASTLSLLQAGVPLKAPVAGIAMGLISGEVDGETSYVALTDILGAEDAFGDMDFKVAGTREFVTALQLDTKLDGIPAEVLASALTQARDARLAILDVMNEAIDAPEEMSIYAPRIITIKIPVDKIGEVIGPKGKIINQIQDDTGAQLTIEDDGTIYIGATNGEAAEAAKNAVNAIANPTMPEIGERYLGTIVKTTNFGAFVSLMPGKDGLLHITKLRALVGGKRVDNVEDVVSVGQKIQVQIAEIDDRGKLSLIPVVDEAPSADASVDRPARRHAGPEQRRGVTRNRSAGRGAGTTRTLKTVRDGAGQVTSLVRRTVLPGGLRVITEQVAGARSASIGVWVDVGSRDESPSLHGCSHFLEHLLFKGTAERSALDISVALDAVGGEFNAFTAKEYTCFHARVLDEDLPLAIDVLGDMVTASTITPEDVEAERDVILDEIAMHDDDPDDVVHNLFASQAYGDTPLGRPIAGTEASISSMSRDQIWRFYKRHYSAPHMVVAVAGNLDHATCVRRIRKAFARNGFLDDATAVPASARSGRARRGVSGSASPSGPSSRSTSCWVSTASRAATTAGTRWACSTPPSGEVRPRACSRRSARSAAWRTRSSPSPPTTPTPAWSGSRSAACRPSSTTCSPWYAPSSPRSAPTASPTRSSSAARASSAAAWSSASRTPAPGCPASARASSSPTSCSRSTRSSPASTPSPSTTSAPSPRTSSPSPRSSPSSLRRARRWSLTL